MDRDSGFEQEGQDREKSVLLEEGGWECVGGKEKHASDVKEVKLTQWKMEREELFFTHH